MKILIIDDEEVFREDLAELLRLEGHDVATAPDGQRGLERAAEFRPAVALCDLVMPGLAGMEVVERLAADLPECAVLVVTAHATLDAAVRAFRLGAVDVVLKPVVTDVLSQTLARIAESQRLRTEVGNLRRALVRRSGPVQLIGSSPAFLAVHELIEAVAPHASPVLIVGESGTGKEVVAQAIHLAGPRRDGPFVAVNCAALPAGLFESELFGHAKGAFTGATARRQGFFEVASGGTLLLDEIGEIELGQQAKLLRAIERKEIVRVGESRPVPVDVRILASTNRDLKVAVEEETFRADVYYRLRVVEIALPRLRDRPEDVPTLVEHFNALFSRQMNIHPRRVEAAALEAMQSHAWPGNVRELENAIERALIVGKGDTLRRQDLPPEISGCTPSSVEPVGTPDDLRAATALFERTHIRRVLEEADGNRAEAARRLGVDPSTLWRKLTQGPATGPANSPSA